ncbi:uncharacterized protein PHALS_05643 [Plasmopara halstedii]|uniref:Uncharacterized protein n=1 Tax=Plasmopara halstedii TaxID=4781 RepID=A0A0P1B0G8_PLAHL|nr:uncharacterized protein PHALS_05643 [Plasmopara halstedii]CEG48173.1 hypothetical protein PHALS_05643 [Plasmopara halstedii]|eukprot:XP_024584542.1 hypothetical protein PHALS_05643 [Plasmopara halstedii]
MKNELFPHVILNFVERTGGTQSLALPHWRCSASMQKSQKSSELEVRVPRIL